MTTSPLVKDDPSEGTADASSYWRDSVSADLLRDHHSQLTQKWASALHGLTGSDYSVRPFEELLSSCDECLRAYEACLRDEDPDPLWQFIERVCQMRASMQFPPAEVTEAFMVFLEIASDHLSPEVKQRETWDAVMKDFRKCTRSAIKSFINAYWIHLELAQTPL